MVPDVSEGFSASIVRVQEVLVNFFDPEYRGRKPVVKHQ
jgi:hypothetical protein